MVKYIPYFRQKRSKSVSYFEPWNGLREELELRPLHVFVNATTPQDYFKVNKKSKIKTRDLNNDVT